MIVGHAQNRAQKDTILPAPYQWHVLQSGSQPGAPINRAQIRTLDGCGSFLNLAHRPNRELARLRVLQPQISIHSSAHLVEQLHESALDLAIRAGAFTEAAAADGVNLRRRRRAPVSARVCWRRVDIVRLKALLQGHSRGPFQHEGGHRRPKHVSLQE